MLTNHSLRCLFAHRSFYIVTKPCVYSLNRLGSLTTQVFGGQFRKQAAVDRGGDGDHVLRIFDDPARVMTGVCGCVGVLCEVAQL